MFDLVNQSIFPWNTSQAITQLMQVFDPTKPAFALLPASTLLAERPKLASQFIDFIQHMQTHAGSVTIKPARKDSFEKDSAVLQFPHGTVQMPVKTYNMLRAANAEQLAGLLAEYRRHHPDTMPNKPDTPTPDFAKDQLRKLNRQLENYTENRLDFATAPVVERRFMADGTDVPLYPIDEINPLTNQKRLWKDLAFIKAATKAEHDGIVATLDEMDQQVLAAEPGTDKAKFYTDLATANQSRMKEMRGRGLDPDQIPDQKVVISADKTSPDNNYQRKTHNVVLREGGTWVFDAQHRKSELPPVSTLAHELSHSFDHDGRRYDDETWAMRYERMFNPHASVQRSTYHMALHGKDVFPGTTLTFGELTALVSKLRYADESKMDRASIDAFRVEHLPIVTKLADGFGKTVDEFSAEYDLGLIAEKLRTYQSDFIKQQASPSEMIEIDPTTVKVPLATPAGAMPVPGGKGK